MALNPFFSIITPVFNRADCIVKCIESVLMQKFDNYELIIVNDGSIDNTLSLIQNSVKNASNVNLITYSDNKGVNYARNRGIEQVRGEFILFLDSDDYLHEDALRNAYQAIQDNNSFDHYLFNVSDRLSDGSLPEKAKEYAFKDWITNRVGGDFVHVLKPQCFDGQLFFEEYRLYESLNWLRILRKNERQLFIPCVVTNRDRNRQDSLTKEAYLDNRQALHNNYNFLYQFITLYGEDFIQFKEEQQLIGHFKKAFILGIALKEKARNKTLIEKLAESGLKVSMYRMLNNNGLSFFAYNSVVLKSKINQLKGSK